MQDTFRIIETIYQSWRTEIYKAVREADGLPVILKTRGGMVSVESETGLPREFELGKSLKGDRTVEYLTLERENRKSTLVLRDDNMNALESKIPEEGFDLPRFLTLASEIASAIEEIHGQGVIHKDVNPANIVVNPALDEVKLIDFGLATGVSEEIVGFEALDVLQGTISHISPEQTGRVNIPVDSRSDLYSLGATLHQLLTGKPPFDQTSPSELIYAHIALTPTPVFEIRQDIPRAVSRVIEKLLKKSPDERYQTAEGVKRDLLYLGRATSGGKKIIDFTPGQNEPVDRIVLSGRLYGRVEETARLLDCFRKSGDAGQVVAATGPAGIGKSALIRELYTPITTQKGFFLAGRFDQLKTNLAYTAFAEALKDFVRQCSGQDMDAFNTWKDAVRSSVGEFGQVLTDIVPEFQGLIGKQPTLAPVSPLETVTRRNSVFSKLIQDICAVGRPLVMFLDDLHWADSATLSLLEKIIEINPRNLLLILSLRDDEISPDHPARLFLDNARASEMACSTIHLDSLNEAAVNDWMNDILPGEERAARELAARAMTKTEGNPFYITSFLHLIIEKNYIRREADGGLSLDMEAVTSIPADADVVAHLIGKIQGLGERDREFLIHASILGARFSLETMDLFLERKHDGYQDAVQSLVGAHLLIKSGGILMFAHDKVRLAARALLDDGEIRVLCLKAGRNIRAALDARGEADEHIEDYIHHYNAAADLITDPGRRLELARLNATLGKRLKGNAAYHAAEGSFARAIAFLPPKPFETHRDMAVDLFTEYGETLFLNLKYEEGERRFNAVLSHTRSPLDRAKVYVKQIDHHASHHHPEKSMNIALRALETLGVKLPVRWLKASAVAELLKVKWLLRNKKPEDVLDLPTTENPRVLAQMDVLAAATVPAYLSQPDYWPILILKMVRISITEGSCPMSPFAYIGYAVILCGLGDATAGYAHGRAALALMEKLDAKQLLTKASYLFGIFVHHWKAHARDSVTYFKSAIAGGLETGDYEFAPHAANNIMHISFYFGKKIDALLNQYPEQHKILAGFGKDHAIYQARYWHQFLITMNDPVGDGVTVSGDIVDEKALVSLLEERRDLASLGVCAIGKMQLAYLAGDYETAASVRERAIELLKGMTGSMFIPVCHFFAALTCIARLETRGSASLLRDARRSLRKLRKWGADAPDNYLHKAQLVEAELLAARGRQNKALALYEAAIENARKAENSLDLGIACERMGRYLKIIGLKTASEEYIRLSITVFHDWGAFNKSNRLSREFNIRIGVDPITTISAGTCHTSMDINDQLNLDTLAGTIRALTSNFDFQTLLATLLDAVMQSSGATRVVYIHVDQGRLRVGAEKRAAGDATLCEGADAHPSSFALAAAPLEKCASGAFDHVLENTRTEREPGEEAPETPRLTSILIIPLKRRKTVKGLVYLENDLMADAFREDQAQFLTLLAGQAAIAMENAQVFERLNAERDYSSNIIQNSPGLICGIDGDGIATFINPVIEKVTGCRKEALIGENWWEALYPGEEYEQVERLFRAFAEGEVVDYEMRLTRENGEKRDIVWTFLTERDDSGAILKIMGFGNDITDRKRAERFRNMSFLVESAANPVAMFTLEGQLTHVNPAFLRTWGYDRTEEVLGRSISDFWVFGDRLDEITRAMRAEEGMSGERRARRRDGSHFEAQIAAAAVRDDAGRPIALMASTLDITERKRAEEELRRLQNYLSNIIDSMPSILIGVDAEGMITQWNREAARVAGVSVEKALGRPLARTFPRLSSEMERVSEAIRTRETLADFRRAREEDGVIHHEDVSIYPLIASGVEGAVIRVDDVSGQVQVEEMMVQSEKMLSVGGLAAGMAHEINNPLAIMMQNADVMNNRLTNHTMPANLRAAAAAGASMEAIGAFMESRGIIGMLSNIRESGHRAAGIVTNMLNFSRKSDSKFTSSDLAELLDQTADLAGSDYDLKKKHDFRQIEIVREYEKNLPGVPCETGKIQQVLLNILRNGAESMRGGMGETSRLTLRLSHEKEAGWVRMEIEDNGVGMDEATRKRVFEPFFTTKPPDQGTGLGLSVSYFIISDTHHGEMSVESTPGVGTKFIIRLPVKRK